MSQHRVWYIGRKRRFAYVGMAIVAFVMLYQLGATTPLAEEDAQDLRKTFLEETKDIDSIGIFLNNFRIAATMFVPALGVGIGLFSAYSTGMVFRALVQTTPGVGDIPPLIILATPFGAMEMVSYGIAMSQGAILLHAIVRRHAMWPALVATAMQVCMVAAVLLVSAFVEFYMIESLAPTGVETSI